MNQKRVLVVGATGTLGRPLSARLRAAGRGDRASPRRGPGARMPAVRTSLIAVALLAAACGSKSPAPVTPEAPASTEATPAEPGEDGPGAPAECDSYCAEGCAEVELTEECLVDCGCPKDWTGE